MENKRRKRGVFCRKDTEVCSLAFRVCNWVQAFEGVLLFYTTL